MDSDGRRASVALFYYGDRVTLTGGAWRGILWFSRMTVKRGSELSEANQGMQDGHALTFPHLAQEPVDNMDACRAARCHFKFSCYTLTFDVANC